MHSIFRKSNRTQSVRYAQLHHIEHIIIIIIIIHSFLYRHKVVTSEAEVGVVN